MSLLGQACKLLSWHMILLSPESSAMCLSYKHKHTHTFGSARPKPYSWDWFLPTDTGTQKSRLIITWISPTKHFYIIHSWDISRQSNPYMYDVGCLQLSLSQHWSVDQFTFHKCIYGMPPCNHAQIPEPLEEQEMRLQDGTTVLHNCGPWPVNSSF